MPLDETFLAHNMTVVKNDYNRFVSRGDYYFEAGEVE